MIRKYEILKLLLDEFGTEGFVVCRIFKRVPKQHIYELKNEGYLNFYAARMSDIKYHICGSEYNSHIAFITMKGLSKLHEFFPDDESLRECMVNKAISALSRK